MPAIARVALVLLVTASSADAQIVQAVNRFANAGEPEQKTNDAVKNDADDKGTVLLSQASAQTTSDGKTQIALQAVDLWMSRKTRLYTRLTLPVKAEAAAAPAADGSASDVPVKPSDGVVKQLVDPFGGVFNLSGGLFARLGRRSSLTPQEIATRNELFEKIPTTLEISADQARQLLPVLRKTFADRAIAPKNYGVIRTLVMDAKLNTTAPDDKIAAEVESAYRKVAKMQPDHGAFLDIRAGLKMIDLPGAGERAVDVGGNKVNVFYTGVAGLKLITPLSTLPLRPSEQAPEDIAGGVTLGAYVVANRAADVKQSSLFTTALDRQTMALTMVVGVNISNVAALTFSLTPWSSDDRLGKVFVFGFDVLRATADDGKK